MARGLRALGPAEAHPAHRGPVGRAARGRTGTIWWTGLGAEALRGAVNVADRALKRLVDEETGKPWRDPRERWLEDGFPVHAPARSLGPDPFGFHRVIGNVSELCLDVVVSCERPSGAGSGAHGEAAPGPVVLRAFRGGSWEYLARDTGSADRAGQGEGGRFFFAGVRSTRAVESR